MRQPLKEAAAREGQHLFAHPRLFAPADGQNRLAADRNPLATERGIQRASFYWSMLKPARRLSCQHCSFDSVQKGFSLP